MAPTPPAARGLELPSFILAALTATGGIIGYLKTGSIPSVTAGLTVGILYAIGGYRIQNRQPYGIEISLVASLILGGASIPRAVKLMKPVPIVLSLLSTYGILTFGKAWTATA